MNVKILRQVLDWMEDYEAEIGSLERLSKAEFAHWLLKETDDLGEPADEMFTEMYIATYLGYMQKFTSYYARRLFRNSAIYSMDDYAFLVSLYPHNELKKTDLIQANAMEKSSGTEIIKRMLKRGQLEEYPHPEDGRARMVALTDQGRKDLESIQPSMQRLTRLTSGNLEFSEKVDLLQLLKKLNYFHREVFEEADEASLKNILQIN